MPTAGGTSPRRLLFLYTYSYNKMHLSYKITEGRRATLNKFIPAMIYLVKCHEPRGFLIHCMLTASSGSLLLTCAETNGKSTKRITSLR